MESGKEFPQDQVWIYRDCVPEETVKGVRDLATAYAQAPTYWLPKEVFKTGHFEQVLTPAESAIVHLYHTVAKHRIPDDCTGAEWWVQVYEAGQGLAFHFDKDEHLLETDGIMKHPSYASVLYLTGTDEDRLRQACTVILDQRFDSETGTADPESPSSCVIVPPAYGKYCMFDGRLGHGVLNASNLEWRATLLINWWMEKPAAIERPSLEALQQLAGNEGGSELTACEHLQYPIIRIPSEDEDVKQCGILVDDLFDTYLLDAFGVHSVQAVAVWHQGHVLYPVDPSKTKQDISKKLIIPAAFIPDDIEVGPS